MPIRLGQSKDTYLSPQAPHHSPLCIPMANVSGPVLRDTARLSQRYPPIARYGVFGVSTWPIGCDTPSPFLSVSPWESVRSGGAIPPPPLKRGISAIVARCPMKTRQKRAIPPSAILSRKGIARYGGVSHIGPLSGKFKELFAFSTTGLCAQSSVNHHFHFLSKSIKGRCLPQI